MTDFADMRRIMYDSGTKDEAAVKIADRFGVSHGQAMKLLSSPGNVMLPFIFPGAFDDDGNVDLTKISR
jgi:hypothetical protein